MAYVIVKREPDVKPKPEYTDLSEALAVVKALREQDPAGVYEIIDVKVSRDSGAVTDTTVNEPFAR